MPHSPGTMLTESLFPEAVKTNDARVVYGTRLIAERHFRMKCIIRKMDQTRPFNYDVFEGKPFIFTIEEECVQIHMHFQLHSKNEEAKYAFERFMDSRGSLDGEIGVSIRFKKQSCAFRIRRCCSMPYTHSLFQVAMKFVKLFLNAGIIDTLVVEKI